MSRRTDRIAEQLRSEIARVLAAEVTDPRIRLVTLTRVEVDTNLSRARILWSALGTDSQQVPEQVGEGLRSAASFIRGRLAQVLPLRRIPELDFRYDPSLVQGDEMLALLKTLSTEAGDDQESDTDNSADGIEGNDGEST